LKGGAAFGLGIVSFLVFLFVYNVGLASEVSKAYLTILCGAMFFVASLSSRGGRIRGEGAEAMAVVASSILAALILFSLPLPTYMISLLPTRSATTSNSSQGTLSGPRALLTLEISNAHVLFKNWNRSGYRIEYNLTARAFSKGSAERLLDKCRLQIADHDGNISISLSGPEHLQRRIRSELVVEIPRNVTANLVVTVTNGSVNFTGAGYGRVDSWLGAGRIDGRSFAAWTCRLSVDKGTIDLEVLARKIQLQTIGGDIRLLSLRPVSDCLLQSVRGRIQAYVNFSDEVDYRVEANTLSGSIAVNLTGVTFTKQKEGFVLARTKDFRNKQFNATIEARTTTGNVTIAELPAARQR